MVIKHNEIDSKIFNYNILDIHEYEVGEDFYSVEADYIEKYSPIYVLCKVKSNDLPVIHEMCKNGFSYIEFQIKYKHELDDKAFLQNPDIIFYEVKNLSDLEKAKDIASKTFTIDRIFIDTEFKSLFSYDISAERYNQYVSNSYYNENEKVYLVEHKKDGVIGFFTMFYPDNKNDSAILFLIGLRNSFKGKDYGKYAISSYMKAAFDNGYRSVISNLSGINIPMMNVEINKCKAKVIDTYVVLRKIYKENIK